jgi:tetratricopeptide (TPR) repeat protein
VSLSDLIAALNEIPDQQEPVFPFEVRRIVDQHRDVILDSCQRILELSESEIRALGGADPECLRFLALYALLLINWREFNYPRYRELVDDYGGNFDEQDYPYFLTFRSQYYFSRGDDLDDIEQALDYARAATEKLPHGPAVLHLMASATAKVAEAGGAVSDEQYEEAERAINAAIRIDRDLVARGKKKDRFARYHATNARLLTLRGRHRDARGQLHKAFELESPHAASRIAEYLEIRGQIALAASVGPVKEELNSLAERIEQEAQSLRGLSSDVADQIRLQAVQLLGLLAAVLAFLFTGTEVARNLDFEDATKLMTVVSGSILIVFSGFSLIFYAEQMTLRRAGVATLAVGIGGGLLVTGILV